MKKVLTIIRKEWLELFRNRLVIFTVVFLPLLMAVLPLRVLSDVHGSMPAGGAAAGHFEEVTAQCSESVSSEDCMKVVVLDAFIILFMVVPVAIPGVIAGYSVVGEKITRSLEPLLATPITTLELLSGKCLAAFIPAVLATFGAFLVFAVGAAVILGNFAVVSALLDGRRLLAVGVVGPLLAFLAVTFALIVSSRVSDPRVAQQISMTIVVPVVGGFIGEVSGLFILSKKMILVTALIVLVLDAAMFWLATRVFERESILTRWR